MDEVEAIIGRPAPPVMLKQIGALDDGCRAVLARSPLAAFGYRDGDGTSVTTFVGGRPGFARMLSPTRIGFGAPPGARGPVSMFFLLPGVGEVLRLNGTVTGSTGTRTPVTESAEVDVTVRVEEAFVHCAQAVLRSRLWQPPAPAVPVAAVPGEGPLSGPGIAEFLAAAPFLALSTWAGGARPEPRRDKNGQDEPRRDERGRDEARRDKDGRNEDGGRGGSDTSPRGDQGLVARILDGRTLVIADRKGNRRADTLHNLMSDDRVSLAALIPGRAAVLHLRGRATVTDDPALLATLALRGTAPHAALVIDVEHAETAGNKAVTARLWDPGNHVAPGEAPDLIVLAGTHLASNTKRGGGLLRALWAVPGIDRLLRRVMTVAYRSGLRKEGYADGTLREVRVAEVRRETPSAVTLVLTDPAGEVFDFRPGQFFTLVTDVSGRPVRRAYSASSAPGSPRLELTVKRVEGGRFSTHVHRRIRAGDRLAVRGPSGTFHLDTSADIVLIAAGSGVTPLMSMIRTRLARPGDGRIALLLTNRDESEVIFAAELARLAGEHPERLSITHVLTGRDGRLDTHRVRHWVTGTGPAPDAHYYLCGPQPLMDTVHTTLTGLGVTPANVHTERYTTGTDVITTEAQELTVTENGRPLGTTTVAPGQTLLDAGLAAGLPMRYSCTAGGCGECTVGLISGDVTRREPDGTVLACVSRPLSTVRLDVARMDP